MYQQSPFGHLVYLQDKLLNLLKRVKLVLRVPAEISVCANNQRAAHVCVCVC